MLACSLIVVKSILSAGLQWFATRRFAAYELLIGDQLFDAYIKAPWTERLRRNTSQLVRLADVGIAAIVGGFLIPLITLPAMLATFLAVVVVLVVSQPLTAVITLAYLGLIALLLYALVSRRATVAGRVNRDYSFKVAALMTEWRRPSRRSRYAAVSARSQRSSTRTACTRLVRGRTSASSARFPGSCSTQRSSEASC